MGRVQSNEVGQMETGKCRGFFFGFLALVGLLPAGDVKLFDLVACIT